jgi:hypothetical protein
MQSGNQATDDGNFVLAPDERAALLLAHPEAERLVRRYTGSREFIQAEERYCLWINDEYRELAESIPTVRSRVQAVGEFRRTSRGKQANDHAGSPHRFVYAPHQDSRAIITPKVSSERRPYLPCGFVEKDTIVSNLASVMYGAELWNFSIIASKMHLVWVATVCGKLKTDFRYSNTLGWNTFPILTLTEKNKADLTRCAEDILLAREAHFPATIADLYDPDTMPADLREAHERNDEVLERIYIGRRFRNDTERLEKLFDLYTKMTSSPGAAKKRRAGAQA